VQNKDLTVIIPALNEERTLKACLDSVKKLDPLEIIVVDGGSADRTKEIAEDSGALVIKSGQGRGVQMNAGAAIARGEILLFLHADVRMPEVKNSLASSLLNGCAGGFFRLKFDDDSISTRLVEAFANIRARLLFLPYGDQAIFIKRDIFERLGGFREYPFLEDIDFAIRIKKYGKLKYIPLKVVASARRLKKGFPFSPILVSFRNVFIALLFLFGLSPFSLIKLYK
jgi:rSAM/selenodomain-associated transferase 2